VTVVTNNYLLPDNSSADWDIVTGPDAVAVLALTTEQEVILARQYRPGPDIVLDELPGGAIDAGESPSDAASRELLEETGYRGALKVIGQTFLSANATRRSWAAVATECVRVADPSLEASEFCEPITISMKEFRRHLKSGQMSDVGIAYMCLDSLGLL